MVTPAAKLIYHTVKLSQNSMCFTKNGPSVKQILHNLALIITKEPNICNTQNFLHKMSYCRRTRDL